MRAWAAPPHLDTELLMNQTAIPIHLSNKLNSSAHTYLLSAKLTAPSSHSSNSNPHPSKFKARFIKNRSNSSNSSSICNSSSKCSSSSSRSSSNRRCGASRIPTPWLHRQTILAPILALKPALIPLSISNLIRRQGSLRTDSNNSSNKYPFRNNLHSNSSMQGATKTITSATTKRIKACIAAGMTHDRSA